MTGLHYKHTHYNLLQKKGWCFVFNWFDPHQLALMNKKLTV